MTREPAERRCIGQEDLMLSVWPTDHIRAKEFCNDCPAFDWCRRDTEQHLAGVYGLGTNGTLAGVLYRDGRRVSVTLDSANRKCVGCGLKRKRKGSHYCSIECSTQGQRTKRTRVA